MFLQNGLIIEGRLTEKPEVKVTENGNKYSTFSICFNESKKNKDNGEWTSIPHFFKVRAWNRNAEKLEKMDKGSLVQIIGKLRYNEWQTETNEKKSLVYILADEIRELNYKKKENETIETEEASATENEVSEEQIGFDVF